MEENLKVILTSKIEEWLESEEVQGCILPWLGDDTAEIMATAAMAVFRGIDNAQAYLKENDMLKTEL